MGPAGAPLLRECVQRPGELLLYLPAAWAHLTLNLDAVVAVGAQAVFLNQLENAAMERSAVGGDVDAKLGLGQIMLQNQRFAEARTLLTAADWHPLALRAALDRVELELKEGEPQGSSFPVM